jgi:predicted DNA-binding protein
MVLRFTLKGKKSFVLAVLHTGIFLDLCSAFNYNVIIVYKWRGTMSHVISARLQDEVFFSLESIAENRQRKLSEIVQEAIAHYIEDYADYRIAMERLHDHTDEIVDEPELRRRLGWV